MTGEVDLLTDVLEKKFAGVFPCGVCMFCLCKFSPHLLDSFQSPRLPACNFETKNCS